MLTLADIGRIIETELDGDGDVVIRGCAPLDEAGPDQLTFLADSKRVEAARRSGAAALIVPEDTDGWDRPVLRAANPRLAFARALALFEPDRGRPEGRHPTSVVHPEAHIGERVALGPYSVVEAGARIGDGAVLYAGVYVGPHAVVDDETVIYPNAVIREHVRIGKRCIIHAGAVIGSDGFGYETVDGVHEKIPHVGTVELGDDVEIGALAAIDRATVGVTRIGRGSKIDNLVQVAHNVQIGPGCLVAALVGLSGSTRLGSYVVMGGQAAVAEQAEVGDGAVLAARTGAFNDVPAGTMMSGFPARPHGENMRIWAASQRLPETMKTIRQLSRRVEALEAALEAVTRDQANGEAGPPAAP